ncbi:VOC family protein [Bifidobacterium anseris]|uniref:VOC family protein n=1 Tax=Bifidobacterium anseris TaxID=2020963 RepID=UPI001FAF63BF|nr:VOC family protein [Bifidobacterium anseris]
MFIDHAAVYVVDLERGARFYERYFEGVRGASGTRTRTQVSRRFSSPSTGAARLEVMHNDAVARPVDCSARGYAHVAFNVGSRERVDELTAQLVADGYERLSGPHVTGDGYYRKLCPRRGRQHRRDHRLRCRQCEFRDRDRRQRQVRHTVLRWRGAWAQLPRR